MICRRGFVGAATTVAALLLIGCASPAIRPDTPPQSGAALVGWAFFLPAAPHLAFIGITGRSLCEAIRDKHLINEPHSKPSPCLPVKVTAD